MIFDRFSTDFKQIFYSLCKKSLNRPKSQLFPRRFREPERRVGGCLQNFRGKLEENPHHQSADHVRRQPAFRLCRRTEGYFLFGVGQEEL